MRSTLEHFTAQLHAWRSKLPIAWLPQNLPRPPQSSVFCCGTCPVHMSVLWTWCSDGVANLDLTILTCKGGAQAEATTVSIMCRPPRWRIYADVDLWACGGSITWASSQLNFRTWVQSWCKRRPIIVSHDHTSQGYDTWPFWTAVCHDGEDVAPSCMIHLLWLCLTFLLPMRTCIP